MYDILVREIPSLKREEVADIRTMRKMVLWQYVGENREKCPKRWLGLARKHKRRVCPELGWKQDEVSKL